MICNLASRLFPDIAPEERVKFLLLGAAYFVLLGVYWIMRVCKSTVIFTIAFPAEQWGSEMASNVYKWLKGGTPIVVLLITFIYSKFVDRIARRKLLYRVWAIYGALFVFFAIFFLLIANDMARFGWLTLATIGCGLFLTIESFGAMSVPLFWAFNNSITTTETAKKGYPILIALGHVGALFFCLLLFNLEADQSRLWLVFLFTALMIFTTIFIIKQLKIKDTCPASQKADCSDPKKPLAKKRGGAFAGLTFFYKHPYLVGVFVVSTFYEITTQIIEVSGYNTARSFFGNENSKDFINLQLINAIALLSLTIILSSAVIKRILKRFGTGAALKIFPFGSAIVFGIAFVLLYFQNTGTHYENLLFQLCVFCVVTVIFKALAYAVNYPCKEIMWITTSDEIKFKCKGIVDSFGARTNKLLGIWMYDSLKKLPHLLYASSLLVISVWTATAYWVGRKNKELVNKKQLLS
ncbi:MAG: translocase [Bacillota bacterium]|jgi:AAA family ATP:ADP antiporter